jgi:ubiquinone/menaquinone biosynthesis C-methylase UbiE
MSPYLRLITTTGFTRHMGGLAATDYLLGPAHIKKTHHVLDVGCGAGLTAAHLAQTYGCKVTGLDSSQSALTLAWEAHKNEPYTKKLDFVRGDMLQLPFPDNHFQVVCCESVLLFVKNKNLGLREMTRVLKPGGFLSLNELIVATNENQAAMVEHFARHEMGAHLIDAEQYGHLANENNLNRVLWDEASLNIWSQIISDFSQFFTPKNALLLMEMAHQTLTSKEIREDLKLFGRFIMESPKDTAKNLMTLKALLRKPQSPKAIN